MSGLVEKLEAAEVGSRVLDQAFEIAIGHLPQKYLDSGATYESWRGYGQGPTRDISVAVQIIERALPGWWWTVGKCGLTCHASVGPDRAFVAEPELSRFDVGFHADISNPSTPALALCVAALKAHDARALNLNETRHAE